MPDRGRDDLRRLRIFVVILAVFWTSVMGGLLVWDYLRGHQTARDLALAEAISSWEKVRVFRRWAAGHGGVYVPMGGNTPPNPYLAKVPERDIVTPSGRVLTLVNPAYMIRQVEAMAKQEYGRRGHITSLNPINPDNKPDPWERRVLLSFKAGEKEAMAVDQIIDGEPYLRVMRPMMAEGRCLTCHARQGYKAGQVLGGVSISVPMKKYLEVVRADISAHVFSHLLIWLVGMVAMGMATAHVHRRILERDAAEAGLAKLNRELVAISECNQALVRAREENTLLEDVCRIIREKAGYLMAWVGYAENDQVRTVRPVAWRGVDLEYLEGLRITWDESERGRGPSGEAIRTGRPRVIRDYATDPTVEPWLKEAARQGIRSSISLPLMDEGRAFGVLKIHSSTPDAFPDTEIRLLAELAEDLAYGVVSLRQKAKRERLDKINAARLRLMQYSADHSLAELLEQTLNEAEDLTGSLIGFYHFVETDQHTLALQNWSTRTKSQFCRAEGFGLHYDADQAGVWVDALRRRKPVVHNDYASLEGRKGMPEGHAEVVRELVVPVMRGGLVKAILGVGNKAEDYGDEDLETVSLLADMAWEIAERKRAEEETIAREATLRGIYQASPLGIGLFTYPDRRVSWANQGLGEMTGYSPDELYNLAARDLFAAAGEYERAIGDLTDILESREVSSLETRWRTKDGEEIDVMLTEAPLKPEALAAGLVFTALDITASKRMAAERAALETQLRQSQKMEAIGTMAGGIAHDFNNILASIMGFTELALEKEACGEEHKTELERVLQSSERARDLVSQILTFSRKVKTDRKLLDLNRTVEQTMAMLGSTLPKMISIHTDLDPDLGSVMADPSQMNQLLMNLAVNAADAMPAGGDLTIETGNVMIEHEICDVCGKVISGPYVLLKVADTGLGMDSVTCQRVFEPFFTTKGPGKGTGLGLSTVYGIVTNHGGHIMCRSRLDHGTTFLIYLPGRRQSEAIAEPFDEGPRIEGGKGETVLVVDDEQSLLELGRTVLSKHGYRVLSAKSGEEALEIYINRNGGIDLVLLDLSMPGMGGVRCMRRMLEINPKARIVILSGYSDNDPLNDSLRAGAAWVMSKPVRQGELLSTVRSVLDS